VEEEEEEEEEEVVLVVLVLGVVAVVVAMYRGPWGRIRPRVVGVAGCPRRPRQRGPSLLQLLPPS
jgi:hypothetical protein